MLDAAAEQLFKIALACAWPMVVFIDRTYQGCEEFGGTPHEASPVPAEVGIQWRWAPAWHAGPQARTEMMCMYKREGSSVPFVAQAAATIRLVYIRTLYVGSTLNTHCN